MPELARLSITHPDGQRENIQQQFLRQFFTMPPGPARFAAMRASIMLTWPEFCDGVEVRDKQIILTPSVGWNPWLERTLQCYINKHHATYHGDHVFRSIVQTGCGGAGKSHVASLYAVLWWMLDPLNSIVTLTSTTKDMIRQRLWPVLSHYWLEARDILTGRPFHEEGKLGDKLDAQMLIRAQKGDDKHSISALAVAHGETSKAIHNLKGRHAPRMLLIIDEANGTPEAIFEVIPNMRKNCRDFTAIIIGNPASRLDPHGRALTPLDGWNAIAEDRPAWKTKAVPEWQLDSGLALRYDGKFSPNVIAKQTIWPHIYTWEDWQKANTTPGYVGTANYYFMDRGLHLPDGTTCTVFTEQLFSRCLNDMEAHYTFDGEATMVAFLDPAFTAGGDEAWFRVGKVGQVGGKWRIQLVEGFAFEISPDLNAYDIDYQLARRFIAECKKRRIAPECAGLDCTGGGRGVGAIVAAEWSPAIHYQTWGGAASDQAGHHDGQLAKDLYSNRVTELWWNVRTALENGQMLGFTRTEMVQGCARFYEYKSRRIAVEPKSDMKARVRYSPDQMDSVAGLLAVAMQQGFELEGRLATEPLSKEQLAEALGVAATGQLPTEDSEEGWAEAALDVSTDYAWD